MSIYTFYCCKADGVSLAITSRELDGDDVTLVEALALLDEHQGAAYVSVFDGDRPVRTRHRIDEGLRALLSRPQQES